MKNALGIMAALTVLAWTGGFAWAGALEPTAPPGPTMHTLEDIYTIVTDTNSKVSGVACDTYEAGVPKTGQTTSYATGDDGDLEKGVALPSPRFTDNGDGTVTDNLTGLIWLKNAYAFGAQNWADALTACNTLNSGECGLTDGSVEGDWRLPSIKELQSLIDFSNVGPLLPSGHPFTNVQSDYYWSSTTYAGSTGNAWFVYLYYGYADTMDKSYTYDVWCVRGGSN